MSDESGRSDGETPPVAVEESKAAPAPDATAAERTRITVSPGLADWLARHRCSLAFTCYQTGQLFLVGRLPDGRVSFHQQNYVRAMGLHAAAQRLYLGSQYQVWRLENVLAPGARANADFDRLYVPRTAQTTGDVDVHEIAVDRAGRILFVNTRYSCLATVSVTHGFKPLWKPPFVSALAAEDRCHLNGLALEAGAPAFATAAAATDTAGAWRERRRDGGLLIDLRTDRIVAEGLSMPHSPRVAAGGVWLLDSGRGMLARIDAAAGTREEAAFCPGFLRGLAFHSGHAIATVSLPRDGAFTGLALEEALARRGQEARCGLCIIDLATGETAEWIRLDGAIRELFDVAVLPDVACPMALGINSPDIRHLVSYEEAFGPLQPG